MFWSLCILASFFAIAWNDFPDYSLDHVMNFCHTPRKPSLLRQAEISTPSASSWIYSTHFQVKNECYLGRSSLSSIIDFKILSILTLPFITYNFVFLEFWKKIFCRRVMFNWFSELAHLFTGHSPISLDLKWNYNKLSLSGNEGNKNRNKQTNIHKKPKTKNQKLLFLGVVPKWKVAFLNFDKEA